jgi:hypothetical protein
MALSDFIPERRPVLVNGQALFSVEGLSLETLAVLVKTHLPDLEHVFDIIVKGERVDETFPEQLIRVSLGLATQAPGLVANIIAVASGEPINDELIRTARRLPFPVQVDALTTIGSMTFEEVGGVKKAAESLMSLLARLRTKPLMSQAEATNQMTPTS